MKNEKGSNSLRFFLSSLGIRGWLEREGGGGAALPTLLWCRTNMCPPPPLSQRGRIAEGGSRGARPWETATRLCRELGRKRGGEMAWCGERVVVRGRYPPPTTDPQIPTIIPPYIKNRRVTLPDPKLGVPCCVADGGVAGRAPRPCSSPLFYLEPRNRYCPLRGVATLESVLYIWGSGGPTLRGPCFLFLPKAFARG